MDSGFHSIVDYLFEAVGMRLGFHFIGVEGEVSVGNNIVNAVPVVPHKAVAEVSKIGNL